MPNAFPLEVSCVRCDEGLAVPVAYSPGRLPVVLLLADVRLELEMLRLVSNRTLQLLVCGLALNALVFSTRKRVDKRREYGLPRDTSTPRVVIFQ